MSQARTLSPDEIDKLRSELDGGQNPTVWFTALAVGVPEGKSGKVIALDDSADEDFIQVRPAGSKDVLSFSAGEVTLTKPSRKRKQPETASKATAGQDRNPAKETTPKRNTATSSGNTSVPRDKDPSARSVKNPTASGRKPRMPSGATVTLTADHEGRWNVEVSNGKKRTLKQRPVSASAVLQAAKTLHEDVAEAVEPLMAAAREEQRTRVERLQRELSEAQAKLEELG